jgi:hypothetical protein
MARVSESTSRAVTVTGTMPSLCWPPASGVAVQVGASSTPVTVTSTVVDEVPPNPSSML